MALTAAQKKAKAEAARKEAAYIASLKNPITSQYDSRIAKNAGFDPERVGVMTGSGMTPEELKAKEDEAAAEKINNNKGYNTFNGVLYFDNTPFTGTINGKTYTAGTESGTVTDKPVGSFAPPAVPGTGALAQEKVYAKDTFVNTLKIVFGAEEAAKPYVTKLYDLVSGFYKSGSTEDEALNLALREAKTTNAIPEFTDRFKGIFALEDQLKAGKAVQVPTIAEFMASEAKLGEVLTNAGLKDLATQSFLGDVLGKGKSVLEVGNLISDVFTTIDTAPTALKNTLQTYFPGVDRVSIAKAILTGPEGAAALAQKVKGISVLSAAGTQGLSVDLATAGNIANMGYSYNDALTGFGQVAQGLPDFEKLQEMRLGRNVQSSAAQATLQDSIFGKNIAAQQEIEKTAQEEANRFKSTSGLIGSKALASQQRGAGLI